MLRQPIVAVLGHVDHGKTTLLDLIRQTAIAAKEAGGITQTIGTTEIPLETIKTISGQILNMFGFEISIPGLLFIDTPGHEAFVSLRKRGGSIADIAVLVIDISEGIMPQTEESMQILKNTKTPFIVALNKIDKIQGWHTHDESFLKNYQRQQDVTKEIFEERFYKVVSQLSHRGFESERFDRVQDFKKTVTIVPLSGKTGEGIPELLAILSGLAQQFLKGKLEKTEQSAGMILDVKEVTGLGTAIDCIIYDGKIAKNDFLVLSKPPMIAKIRALLMPEPLRDMRTEKKFKNVEEVNSAAGVKIAAPGLETVVAGSQIRTAKTFEEAEMLLNELEKEIEEVEIFTEKDGIILKADTLGGLEALINIFSKHPIREATVGNITKKHVISAEANIEPSNRAIVGFNIHPSEEVLKLAQDKKLKVLTANVIYHLLEEYEKWVQEEKEATKKKELDTITRPGKILILPGCIFRASNPAIVGCDVISGIVKPGYKLFKDDKPIGEIKQVQSQGKSINEAKIGDKIAVSIEGPTVGRQINESDVLYTDITEEDYRKLKRFDKLLAENELKVMEEIKTIKRKYNPRWGL
ncbi:MAG: translation initiation factor IF-2 [Candidatus Aenigmarchaeota archaeon]|nr:translation initiation factor IF-2 [Candidatus Aenigmarchaeota archaeon]